MSTDPTLGALGTCFRSTRCTVLNWRKGENVYTRDTGLVAKRFRYQTVEIYEHFDIRLGLQRSQYSDDFNFTFAGGLRAYEYRQSTSPLLCLYRLWFVCYLSGRCNNNLLSLHKFAFVRGGTSLTCREYIELS